MYFYRWGRILDRVRGEGYRFGVYREMGTLFIFVEVVVFLELFILRIYKDKGCMLGGGVFGNIVVISKRRI